MDLTRTHARIWPRSTVVVSLAVGSAIALAACGGDNEKKKPQNAGVQTNIPIKTTQEALKPKTKKRANKKSRQEQKKKGKPKTLKEAFARISPSQRAQVLRREIPGIVEQFGYKHVAVGVSAGGSRARVTLSPGEVCGGPEDAAPISKRVRQAAPFLTHFSLEVGSGGQSLGSYVAAHCRAQNPPGARGPVVLTVEGTGPSDSRSFRVRHKRWTVAYSNKGSTLGIFILYGRQLQPGPITTQKRGAGKKVMKGEGTFKLKVVGPGPYKVVVHDGA
jgi:hypothetical protein